MTTVSRYLCSELVPLRTEDGESIANLEEIWSGGAVLECENPLQSGSRVEMLGGDVRFHGLIASVELHEFGYRVEVQFSPLTPWSPDRFSPQHLLDPAVLKQGAE